MYLTDDIAGLRKGPFVLTIFTSTYEGKEFAMWPLGGSRIVYGKEHNLNGIERN